MEVDTLVIGAVLKLSARDSIIIKNINYKTSMINKLKNLK